MSNRSKTIKIICSAILATTIVLLTVLGLGIGELVSSPTTITVVTEGLEAVYDGTPLTNHLWRMTGGDLRDGHQMKVHFTGKQTQIGESDNSAEFTVVDDRGNDVTNEYKIKTYFGKLKVTSRSLVVSSASNHKSYDGLPLTDSSIIVDEGCDGLVPGHKIVADISGTISKPGHTPNTVNSLSVIDESGKDVTENYNFFVKEGFLEIDDGSGGSSGGSSGSGGSSMGSGQEGKPTGSLANMNHDLDKILYMVKTDFPGKVYLKQQSYGSFNGKAWELALAYDKLYEDTYSAHYLSGLAMAAYGASLHSVEIKPVAGGYALPYYSAARENEHSLQKGDVMAVGDSSEAYAVSCYAYVSNAKSFYSNAQQYERDYRSFVYEQYLDVDSETMAYMKGIIQKQNFGTRAKDERLINDVAQYIQRSALYNMDYDVALDSEENIAIAFLEKYREGVCRHYATAATLLYRALGIPARYTVGAFAYPQKGEWVTVTAKEQHAWVEVYVDGMGWVQVEVTGGSADAPTFGSGIGGGGHQPQPVIYEVKPVSVDKKYDGRPLFATNKVTGLGELEEKGYTYQVTVTGSQTEIGFGESVIQSIKVFDPKGRDVTDSLELNLKTGKIHVYLRALQFVSESYSKQYDGKALKKGVKTGGVLETGHSYEVISTAGTGAGRLLNSYRVFVYDKDGNDVSYVYKLERTFGIVNVSRAPLTIVAASAEKKYDGTPLVCDQYSVAQGQLAEGDFISICELSGSQTDVGRCDNIVSQISIFSSENKNATGNYEIKFQAGKLKVTH